MSDYADALIRELTEHLPANSAAAKLLRIVFDDGTGDTETAEAKQNTIGAVLDLIYALRGAVTGSNLTMNTARLLGRTTASAGAIEEMTVGAGLSLSGGSLTAEVTASSMAAAISAAVTALLENKGSIDCGANPNYPAATLNDAYRVSVAGRIGGASGPKVSVGDWIVAIATNDGGDHAAVGASWDIWEGNIPGITSDGLALIQAASFAAMRALLDLEAGADFNAYRAELDKLAVAGSDIASASTTDLAAATGDFANITGTTTITGLGTIAAGIRRLVRFAGSLTLTHNGTSLILPTGANITTAANDIAEFISLGSGNWQCVRYVKANGSPLVSAVWGGIGGTMADQTDLQAVLDALLSKAGGTMTGLLQFSGTGHAGLQLLSLTTTQKNALTPGAGMLLFDSDLGRLSAYDGGAWQSLAVLGANTFTGAQTVNVASGTWLDLKLNGTSFTYHDQAGLKLGMPGVSGWQANIFSTWGALTAVGGYVSQNGASLHFRATNTSGTVEHFQLFGTSTAGVMEQRNAAVAQVFRLYGSYTDASNYERFAIQTAAGTYTVGSQAAGTGTLRGVSAVGAWTFTSTSGVTINDGTNSGAYKITGTDRSGALTLSAFGAGFQINSNGDLVMAGGRLRFTDSGIGTRYGYIFGVGADHLGLTGNGGSQKLSIYGTTDETNYERLTLSTAAAGAYTIKPEAGGTGTLRDLHISGLPTSNPGPGILWNNAGTPAIGT